MLRCKHVADALTAHRYWDLPWHKRWGMHIHVSLCVMCGRYHKHVMLMQEMANRYAEGEGSLGVEEEHLSESARNRICEAVRNAKQ